MAAHRYWRILPQSVGSGTAVAIAELKLRTSLGGAQAAVGGTAIADSYLSNNATYQPSNAFDNNANTIWHTNTSVGTAWIGYDFGAGNAVDIVEIGVMIRPSFPLQAPLTGKVQWSDNSTTWTDAWTFTFDTWGGGNQSTQYARSPDAVPASYKHRYWRVYGATPISSSCSLAELKLRTVAGGAQAAVGGTPIADSYYLGSSTYAPDKAFDNNTATFWNSAGNAGVAWIGYNFGAANPVEIIEISITARNDASYGQTPLTGYVEWSDDGANWSSVYYFTFSTWTQGATQTKTWPSLAPVAPVASRRRRVAIVC